jgi:hypothetical protein
MAAVHISPFSGAWYPSGAAELDRLLEELFESSRSRTGPYLFSDGIGFVVPHAGPQYSGAVAASVYRSLWQQKPERIILLAFPHRGGLRGAAVPMIDEIATPLGSVPIDGSLASRFRPVAENLVCDHSFEIQLPFLQKAARGVRLSALYVGQMNDSERRQAAEALAAEWRPGTVFIASSDFTHYGRNFGYVPFPVDGRTSTRLHDLDFESIDAAGSLDSELFLGSLSETGATVCGADPIALLLDTLRLLRPEDLFQTTLDYQTSGDLTGDFHNSVSYAALGYFGRAVFDLNCDDRQALLGAAEATLRHLRETGKRVPIVPQNGGVAIESRRGVFVSLHRGTELLGCVGNCSGRLPLAQAVPDMALCAALDDPRFPPGAALEGALEIEISVLTPARRARRHIDLQVGRHGALLKLGARSGLLLPQVGARYGWTAAQFLRALAKKSGIDADQPGARLYLFEAQVFKSSIF